MKIRNKVFYVVISLVSVLAIGSAVRAYALNQVVNVEGDYVYNESESAVPTEADVNLGGASGSDKYFQQHFIDGYTSGGTSFNASSTLTAARTITAKEVCNNSYIHVNSDSVAGTIAAASLDLTFPATSTLFAMCLNYPGAEKVFTFRNNSPTAASSTEMIAGTGCDARISEATGADDLIDGLNEARITLRRTDDAFADGGSVDCIMLIEETVVD